MWGMGCFAWHFRLFKHYADPSARNHVTNIYKCTCLYVSVSVSDSDSVSDSVSVSDSDSDSVSISISFLFTNINLNNLITCPSNIILFYLERDTSWSVITFSMFSPSLLATKVSSEFCNCSDRCNQNCTYRSLKAGTLDWEKKSTEYRNKYDWLVKYQ